MPNAREVFLIDATVFFEASHKAFMGAPLLVVNGEDHTFLFGVIRELLRLRQTLGIENGIFVIGEDAYEVTTSTNIEKTAAFLKQLGIPVICDPNTRVIDLCVSLASLATCIVTGDRKLLLLAKNGRRVILLKDGKEPEVFGSEAVVSTLGVIPELVPAFLALTDGPQPTILTKGQAIALLERHGGLVEIINTPSIVSSRQIRNKLAANGAVLLQRLKKFSPSDCFSSVDVDREHLEFNVDNDRSVQLLARNCFHSLVRLLPRPVNVNFILEKTTKINSQNYRAVVTPENLRKLATILSASEVCAVDTESSDKDPHTAELFGVSFSVKKGEAFYVPVVESDLNGINRDAVISTLKGVLEGPLKVVGHNLKYDYVLLRRNGIKITNVHFDTLLAAYDCFGDWDLLNLPFVAKRLLGKDIKSYKEVVGKRQSILDVPFNELLTHACSDADTTLQLYKVLDKELSQRNISQQYRNETLALASHLGEWECDGIPINSAKLSKARTALLREVAGLKKLVLDEAGISFDIDSEKELLAVLTRKPGVAELIGSRKLSLHLLEELAVSQSLAWKIVQYRRKQSQLRHVEEVLKTVQAGKIHPVFNQTKFDHGRLSSVSPKLLDEGAHPAVISCIDHPVVEYAPSASKSLDIMQDSAQDDVLRKDRRIANGSNLFLKTQMQLNDVDHEGLLLAILSGVSKDRICRIFCINQAVAAAISYDLEVRYTKSFKWLADYRRRTAKCGFATANNRRRWFDGIRSSNLGKREKALTASVRWLLKY